MFALTPMVVAAAPVQADRSTPETALQSLLTALLRQDLPTALLCLDGAKPSAYTEEFLRQKPAPAEMRFLVEGVTTTPRPDGTVEASFTLGMVVGDGTPNRTPDRVVLRQTGGAWQVVPPSPEQAAAIVKRGAQGGRRPGDFVYALVIPFFYPDAAMAGRDAARKAKEKMDAELAAIRREQIAREVGRVGRLVDWETARRDRRVAPPVFVGRSLDDHRAHIRLRELEALERGPIEPTAQDDGYTRAQLQTSLVDARQAVAALDAAGGRVKLLHGTAVRVLDYRLPLESGGVDSPWKLALSGESVQGAWQVEVTAGPRAGERFWTDAVVGQRPTYGDRVTLHLPRSPNAPVPCAADLDAGAALRPGGRVGDAKARARFDRLVREKRFVLLPAGTLCDFVDALTDGSGYLVRPRGGPYSGKPMQVRAEHVRIASPRSSL